ncbi:MAG: MFS transporter [Spongiibacteraceae bacterium]
MNNEVVATTSWPPILRAFRYRYFRWMFAGQLVSLIGTWVQNIALSWLVYRLTGSPVMLGIANFANQIPGLIFSPFGGVIADRFDRRRIIIVMQSISAVLALIMGVLTLTGLVEVWHIFVIGTLLGTCSAFEIPARHALVSELVERPDLPNAIALNTTAFNASRVVGPGIAGVLVGLIGEGWCFLANAISFVPVIAGLAFLHMTLRERPVQTMPAFKAIFEGFGYFAKSPPLRFTAIVVCGIGIAGNGYTTFMPVFADKVLHGGAHTLGWLMGAAGFGALLGALGLASRATHVGLSRWIEFGAIGLGVCLIAFSWSPWLPLSMLLLAGVGICWVLGSTSANTLFQSTVPDAMRGRAVSIYVMILMGGTPIGALLGGALAEVIGVSWTTSIGGAICVGAGVWYGKQMARLRAARTTTTTAA